MNSILLSCVKYLFVDRYDGCIINYSYFYNFFQSFFYGNADFIKIANVHIIP